MLEELRQDLSVFNSLDLLGKVGALQLLPENAGRRVSLDALAHLVGAQAYNSAAPAITRRRLQVLLEKHLSETSTLGMADDPPPEMFTDEVTFVGGPYVAIPGTFAGAQDIVKWLLRAALLKQPWVGPNSFRADVVSSALLCLAVSNQIALRAGLQRGTQPSEDNSRNIVVPPMKLIKRGSEAVTFSRRELVTLVGDESSFDNVIPHLSVNIGEVDWASYSIEHGEIHDRPFVQAEDRYVVPDPSSLLSGLIHRIFSIALEHSVLATLTGAYHEVVWAEITMSLMRSGLDSFPHELPSPSPTTFSERLFKLDTDKVLYVRLATDDRFDFDGEYEPEGWNVDLIQSELEQRNNDVVDQLSSLGYSSRKVLTLTLLESTGRPFVMALRDSLAGNLQLVVPVSSFVSMSILDGHDSLWLWKFARSRETIMSKSKLMSFDILDEYAIYRERESYYLSDEILPNLMTVAPGSGLTVKRLVREQVDPHGVVAFEQGQFIDVWCALGETVPIYFPPPLNGRQPALVIEGMLPLPLWIVGKEDTDSQLSRVLAEIVEMFAYWIWQFESLVGPTLNEVAIYRSMLRVDLVLDDPDQWLATIENGRLPGTSPRSLVSKVEDTQCGVKLYLAPSILTSLNQVDNECERTLVREFLHILGEYIRKENLLSECVLTSQRIDTYLDAIAPLGHKKKMVLMTGHPILYEGPHDLPSFRGVQKADSQDLLDQVGDHIANKYGLGRSFDRPDLSTEVVNEAVGHLYLQLREGVAGFDGVGLLTKLMARNEVNIMEIATSEITTPTRLACFGEREKLVETLVDEMHKQDVASLANRFLIEYVGAELPSGEHQLSMEAYDKLLALASEILNLGMLSDLIHFGLSDMEITTLPSRRLGFNRMEYETARQSFMTKLTGERIALSERQFTSHWNTLTGRETIGQQASSEVTALDSAFAVEFGLSLTETIQFLSETRSIGTSQPSSVKVLPRYEFITSLCRSLDWDECKVTSALDILSMKPRKDFLRPNDFGAQEVYPWRFNRSLSFTRRPLVTIGSEVDSSIFWGNRHLALSIEYIANLSISGRLKATTVPLKLILSDIRQSKATEFEDDVGRVLDELTGVPAHVRVRKVGRQRIMEGGRDLGDIDVLSVIPNARVILCVECKALALARTPAEIRYQLEELFEGSESKPPTTKKHLRRAEWVEENLDLVLEVRFGLAKKGRWRVKPILVSDSELFASYLGDTPFPALSIESLKSMTAQELSSI